jgi:PAS domain S-box-containing protein
MRCDTMAPAVTEPRASIDLGALLQPVIDDVAHLGIDGAAIFVRWSDEPVACWACDAGIGAEDVRGRLRTVRLRLDAPPGRNAAWRRALGAAGSSPRDACLPLLGTDGSAIGVLVLIGGSTARPGSAPDGALQDALVQLAALAVENARSLQRLRDVEARHHFLLDRLPDVIWAAGPDRLFTYVSAGVEPLLGYRPEELIGRSSEIVMHESSSRAFEEGYRWQIAHPDADQTYQVNARHKDGHPVPVELHNIGTPIDGRYGGGTGSVREITERLRMEREIREQAAELAAGRERAHLAQELHDSVTQALFSMTMTAGAARMLLEQDRPGVEAKLEELGALAREALAEMRGLILELRPDSVADEGLETALGKHLVTVQGRTGLPIRLEIQPGPDRLPLSIEDALYRIAREAIHNVVKHARATEATVRLTRDPTTVRLEVRDDGVGFRRRRKDEGLGLDGMAARAERLGGSLTVRSSPGHGTVVSAELPVGPVTEELEPA